MILLTLRCQVAKNPAKIGYGGVKIFVHFTASLKNKGQKQRHAALPKQLSVDIFGYTGYNLPLLMGALATTGGESLAVLRYRLDDLGWFQFEWLCQSLLKLKFGIAIESWGGHSDLGREAYYDGPLVFDSAGKSVPGPHVFQAKFVQEANAAGARPFLALTKAISSECNALQTRFSSRKVNEINNYVLLDEC